MRHLPKLLLLYLLVTAGLISCATPPDIVRHMQAVRENPQDAKAHLNLGIVYLRHAVIYEGPEKVGHPIIKNGGTLNKAEEEFEEAVRLDDALAEPHYYLKIIFDARGKYDLADQQIELYKKMLVQQKREFSEPK